jgi:G:T-mismatch repair DNA endonuclease (very short patch repair protein)
MATTPKTNTGFWLAKFTRNVERDCETKVELRKLGYEVLTIWECETEGRVAPLMRRLAALLEKVANSTQERRYGRGNERDSRMRSSHCSICTRDSSRD